MHIQLKQWQVGEGYDLSVSKNEVSVPGFLLKYFPHPYTDADALNFIHFCQGMTGKDLFYMITVDGKVAGGAFLGILDEPVRSAKIGYWISEYCKGIGMAAWVVEKLTEIAFEQYGVWKIHAGLIAEHVRSHKVVHKEGPSNDAKLHQYVQKYGRILELHRYTELIGETRVRN